MTRVPNYVVAYEATAQGRDALELGIAMARLTAAELRVCLVLQRTGNNSGKIYAPASDFENLLESQAEQWLAEALVLVPEDVIATTHLLWSDSTTEGLITAVGDFQADRIVVGAARDGILNRFTIGSVANGLLHASPVPVALAPRDFRATAVSRVTCAIGTRPGWEALLDSVAALTEGLDVDLRFVTLVEVDAAHQKPPTTADSAAHLESVLGYYARHARAGGGRITTEVGEGTSVETAVEALDWRPNELAIVGSSRLAAPRTIFLGITAHRMLHALPVPLIVVPASPAHS